MWSVPVWVALAGLVVVSVLALRDSAAQRTARRAILDECARLLNNSSVTYGRDGFPRLDGLHQGQRIRVELIPDTMTIRRLPQLWLALTKVEARKGRPEFAVLVRPAGTEFYALTHSMARRLDAPKGWPDEVMVRGSGESSQVFLAGIAPCIGRILSDGRVKEIAATAAGLRILWQASEGRRGEHLLLRQTTFDDASVSANDFRKLLDALDELGRTIDANWKGGQT
jgi:hypothetical protein